MVIMQKILLPLPGTPGKGLGRAASDAPRRAPFHSSIDHRPANRTLSDSTRTLPLSPALSPAYGEEGDSTRRASIGAKLFCLTVPPKRGQIRFSNFVRSAAAEFQPIHRSIIPNRLRHEVGRTRRSAGAIARLYV